jgi:hypothetical protein
MGVRCTIMTKDGHSFKIDYVCFGFLRHMDNISDDWYAHTELSDGKRKNIDESEFDDRACWELHNIKHIDYLPAYSHNEEICKGQKKRYASLIKEVLKAFPMFDNFRYMPVDGKIRCVVHNQPADKVLLGLMLCRNMSNIWREKGSLAFAVELGYPLPVAVLVDTMYCRFEDYRGNHSWNFDPGNEDCIFDPFTGGEKAMSDFLKQPKGYNPWYQSVFAKNNPGYCRDSDFSDDGVVMNSSGIEPIYDEWDDIDNHDELSETGETFFRKLISCFSMYYISGDEPLEGWQYWRADLEEFGIESRFVMGLKDEDIIKVLDIFNSLYTRGTQLNEKAS